MAVFPKFKITNKGLDILNRSIAEKKALTFTKFKIGNGVPSGNWEELNDIVAKFKEFPVLETSVQPNKIVRVKGYFDNKGLTQDYLLKEIGVFATLEGVPGEILYSYTNAGDTADTIPDENNGFFSRTFDVSNYISNATQVTFQVIEQRFDFNFNTVEEMKNATFLKAGDRLHLWGDTQLGDITTKTLIVADSYSGNHTKYTLKNDKIAIVINDIDTKLDKGLYEGDAKSLKDEIDEKQNKIDNSLETISKQITPAINEVNSRFDNITFYSNLSSLGLSFNVNLTYAINKMKTPSIFYGYYSDDEYFIEIRDYLVANNFELAGTILIYKYSNNRIYITCTSRLNGIFSFTISDGRLYASSETLTTSSGVFLGTLGASNIKYIQDVGVKEKDSAYIDKITKKIYRAKTRNTDVDVTSNFELISVLENSKKIFSKKELRKESNYSIVIAEYRDHYLISGKFYKSYGDNEVVVNLLNELPLADWETLSYARFMPASSVVNNTGNQMALTLITYDDREFKKGNLMFIHNWTYEDNGFQLFVPKK